MNWEDLVVVGRVARAHGNRGEVVVNPETDFPQRRFRPGAELFVRRGDRIETLRVASARQHLGRPVVGFEGLTSMDAAEAMAGSELRILVDEIAPLPPGEFYRHDLVGCRVETVTGQPVGDVTRVEEGPVVDRLAVEGARGEILIPLARDICVAIDPVRKRIVIAPPGGLLELND